VCTSTGREGVESSRMKGLPAAEPPLTSTGATSGRFILLPAAERTRYDVTRDFVPAT